MNRWGRIKVSKEQREEILQAYLRDPVAATAMAVSLGLSAAYAYKLALERGVLPITRWPVPEDRRI